MNMVNILFGLCFFLLNIYVKNASCKTIFALNNYMCSVNDTRIFIIQTTLMNQNETSYSVTIELVNLNTTYKTIISYADFKNVEKKLCAYTHIVNIVHHTEKISMKKFSQLMTIGLKTQLDFYLIDDI